MAAAPCVSERQSGLVRRSCGVCERMHDDIVERFMILIERHNAECEKRWQAVKTNLS